MMREILEIFTCQQAHLPEITLKLMKTHFAIASYPNIRVLSVLSTILPFHFITFETIHSLRDMSQILSETMRSF